MGGSFRLFTLGTHSPIAGHEVKLMHAKYVKAYVRRTKRDAADADDTPQADGFSLGEDPGG